MKANFTWTRCSSAYTLLEMLVAIALVGLLTSLLLCGVQKIRSTSSTLACKAHMRTVALAVLAYETDNQHLPVGCAYALARSDRDYARHSSISWLTAILPYIEQEQLSRASWAAYVADPTGESVAHQQVRKTVITSYLCPADSQTTGTNGSGLVWALSNYLGVAGTGWYYFDGLFHRDLTVRMADINDGTSNTLLVGERPVGVNGESSGWYSGWGASTCHPAQVLNVSSVQIIAHNRLNLGCNNSGLNVFYQGTIGTNCHLGHFWSLHPGGANFAFADGSVRFLRYTQTSNLQVLATRAGNELGAD